MRDQRSFGAAEEAAGFDELVFSLLLADGRRRPWSVEQIVHELGDAKGAAGALARLCAAGFVRCGGGRVSLASLRDGS